MTVSWGIDVGQHQLGWDELLDRVRFADALGLEHAWVFDHFKALYGDPSGPCLEGWSLLAGLGAATERIRIGALVTGVTYRHPSVLAAQAVTVDHISGGRLNLGLGAAWFEDEHRELGIDFPGRAERARRLDEAVEVVKLLMTESGASFRGRHYRLRGASYWPRPVQRPHPPVWIGARGPRRMLPIVGRRADVWHSFGASGDVEGLWRIVAEHAEAAGRDPGSIARATNLSISEPLDDVRRRAEEIVAAGYDYVVLSWPAAGRTRVEEVVTGIVTELG